MRASSITTLFLDAGGVLVFPNWERISDTLRRAGVRVDADLLARAEPAAKFAVDREIGAGAPGTDARRAWAYMELVLEGAGVELTEPALRAVAELRAYHAEHNLWEHVPADVVPALERLRQAGLRLVVVSNANGVLHRAFERIGLTRHFAVICDSCVEGVEKPDPRFFRIALQRSGAAAGDTVHVGDLYHVDVIGARRAGLGAMLLDPHGLYDGYDVARVRTLEELADGFTTGSRERAGPSAPL